MRTTTSKSAELRELIAHVPVLPGDVDALARYDLQHADGYPWGYLHVTVDATIRMRREDIRYAARLYEMNPWGKCDLVEVVRTVRSQTVAAEWAVRYLKWRHGDHWRPSEDGSRPSAVEAFNDEIDPTLPPSWVGRIWIAGRPTFVFADAANETGFAYHDRAIRAAQDLVRERMPKDWRLYLGRYPRPFAKPAPAGILDAPDAISHG